MISRHSLLATRYLRQRSIAQRGFATSAHRWKSTIASPSSGLDFSDTKSSGLDFSDTKSAYSSKSNFQLIRAAVVYKLCNVPLLVKNADRLLTLSRQILGNAITDALMKATLFGHFCAGEDEQRIRPVIHQLRDYGVGGILDYAAESDLDLFKPAESDHHLFKPIKRVSAEQDYDLDWENACDKHVDVFRSCIRSVHEVAPDGFAAVKVTALGNPKLLERMSNAIVQAKNLFEKLDENGDGLLSRDEFEKGYREYFVDADEKIDDLMDSLDPNGTGFVDYITWSMRLKPSELPELTASCRNEGPLKKATPTAEEIKLIEALFNRAYVIAEEAVSCGTRILMDAEQARYQPAIDNLVLDLQSKYNSVDKADAPIIFNTYQCYLKNARPQIEADVERSERFSYHFGAKLVRGAYLESERALAAKMHYPSPIHDTVEDTHRCYNEAVEYLMKHSRKTDKKLELMCATHNQESIEKAMSLMEELGIDKRDGTVQFGQLLGMSDNLTFNLGAAGYNAYKYVPYGEVREVMPYLVRRAQENSAVLGSSTRELELLRKEIRRRLKNSLSRRETSS